MLKFIPTDTSKIGQKRKQCSKACDACRRKKKRCNHLDAQQQPSEAESSPYQDPPVENYNLRSATANRSATNHNHEDDGSQFGNTLSHPGVADRRTSQQERDVLLSQAEARNDSRLQGELSENLEPALGSRFIGDLNPEGIFLAATSPTVTTGVGQADRIGIWLTERLSKNQGRARSFSKETESRLFYGFDPIVQTVMIPLLIDECLALLPPPKELEKLCYIYFEKNHHILPIVNGHAFRAMDSTEPASVLLTQGICLVASLDPSAKQNLRLPKLPEVLSPKEFGRRLLAAMRMLIELDLVEQKLVVIQALSLMSFFADGPDGGDFASQLCGRAVHYTHTIGLHIKTQRQEHEDSYAKTLLCCIWAIDRLNAAFHGRPVLMHERDMGVDLNAYFQAQSVCFRLFLRVVTLLDEVISLYRPNDDKTDGLASEFPLFKDILEDVGAFQVPTPLLTTIETLYHAIAILSCRANFTLENQFSKASYLRQINSAAQITDTMSDKSQKQLSWFPFVPYAITLSLSVAYREMRHSKIPMYRARARAAIIRACDLLQGIEEISWSASIMAEMGKATLKEMDRVYTEVASSRRRKSIYINNSSGADEEDDLVAVTQAESLAPLPENDASLLAPGANWPPLEDINSQHDDIYGLDLSYPIDMGDVDVFAHFDPNFDLEGIDAFLGGNLDMTIPGTF